ncbi:MAG TPA: [FeFe] hydrogenase H-cluster radical SAM maturase HydE, partial [Candidatus Ozemobacteraceae bacterium]|nr:[FeFe] hydrogenase H-cluster radical SAM maturase HydE [Candidatus Ozemobacteraceae bacterium]
MSVQVQNIQKLLAELATRRPLTSEEAAWIFSAEFDAHRSLLYETADRIRKERVGDDVYLRGLIEFSNYCACRCSYCGISALNTEVSRYRMTVEEIVQNVKEAVGIGYRSFVLQSGEDRHFKAADICRLIESLKQVEDIAVTLSIGEWKREDLAAFRAAGADRYLLRIETSDPDLFARHHSDSSWHDRHRCLMDLKELGFQTGSGIMVGLPGQTAETLRRDLEYLVQLRPEMVGIGPFIPHPD